MEKENGKVINLNTANKKGELSFKTLTKSQLDAVYATIGFGTYAINKKVNNHTKNSDGLITKIQFDTSNLPEGPHFIPIYDMIEIEYIDDTNLKYTTHNSQTEEKTVGYIEISLNPPMGQFDLPTYNQGLLVKLKTREVYKNDKLYCKEEYQIDTPYQAPTPTNVEYYLEDLLVEMRYITSNIAFSVGPGFVPKQNILVYTNIDNTKGDLLYTLDITASNAFLNTKIFMGDDTEGKDLLKLLQEISMK